MVQIDLIWQKHVNPFNIIPKFYDKIVGHVNKAIIFVKLSQAFIT